jgi:predicted ArsR family transcriptional regulator
MSIQRWDQRFLASTRGRVVTLLRRASRTVNDLAEELELTDNAVRSHLATLERDGLVRQEGVRREGRKPSYEYGLTPEAESLFPKAYGLVLGSVVDVVHSRLGPEEARAILREAGRRLATPLESTAGFDERVERAAVTIEGLGGLAEVEDHDDYVLLRGFACPLAEAVSDAPASCQIAEALLAEATGLSVRECCDRNGTPRCRFELRPAGPRT